MALGSWLCLVVLCIPSCWTPFAKKRASRTPGGRGGLHRRLVSLPSPSSADARPFEVAPPAARLKHARIAAAGNHGDLAKKLEKNTTATPPTRSQKTSPNTPQTPPPPVRNLPPRLRKLRRPPKKLRRVPRLPRVQNLPVRPNKKLVLLWHKGSRRRRPCPGGHVRRYLQLREAELVA
ncbi:hypothetical protein BDK51DRAFT_39790 [Blyttiomyces helicus]|uniref:Uncharacterized protein n=1 Tax=Blyttiomyces helicus TaxID=388810 RepID=A0A4P9WPB1_9FUNG|nr:hypothetical protein BDK51DRAFT_39790 [Blyttiomyces helicus]|eukprot:RKO93070.1 hypothetical protein BDK51DRAFT_39790 [Blyttiomyces helicus]